MSIDPITAGIDLATVAIKRIWPDKSEEQARELASQLQIVQGQLDINKAEAASPNAFTSSWRPAIGWVCALALFFQYVARPLLTWVGLLTGHQWPQLPGIDNALWELMMGMLGMSGLRTFEKVKGAA